MVESRSEKYLNTISELKTELSSLKDMIGVNDVHPMKAGKKSVATKGVEFYGFLFHRRLLQNVAEVCVVGRTAKLLNEGTVGNYLEKMSLSIQSIMFSKLPENPKTEFHSRVGSQYCLLRRSMVRTALSLVVKDAYRKFKKEGDGKEVQKNKCVTEKESTSTICRPFWCAPNFVQKKHLDTIQTRLESVQKQESKTKPRSTSEKEEHANTVACKLFQQMTKLLTSARERSKKALFESIGFLFSKWDTFDVPLKQFSTEFYWNIEDVETTFEPEEIPSAEVLCPGAPDSDEVNKKNMMTWKSILEENKHFILLVSYEVSVRSDKPKVESKRGDRAIDNKDEESCTTTQVADEDDDVAVHSITDKDVRRMYRAFNILDTAAQFYSSYCGGRCNDAVYDIFASSEDSFRCVYGLACLLKHWMSNLVEDFKSLGPSAFSSKGSLQMNTVVGNSVDGLSLHHLFPCHSRMQTTLLKSCLSLSPQEYDDDCLTDEYRSHFESHQLVVLQRQQDRENETGTNNNIDCVVNMGSFDGEVSGTDDFVLNKHPANMVDEEEGEDYFA